MERALSVASRMVGTKPSRGCCLELVCADFLAGGVLARGDPDGDPPPCTFSAAGVSGGSCRPKHGQGTGNRQQMLSKVKRIKLGKQIYRRLMERVLQRDKWRYQKCGSLEEV